MNDEMCNYPYRQFLKDIVPNTVPQGYPGMNTPWILDAWMDHTIVAILNRVIVDGWDNDKAIEEAAANYQKYYDDWQERL